MILNIEKTIIASFIKCLDNLNLLDVDFCFVSVHTRHVY